MPNKLMELLNQVSSVAIAGHVRPDGDCVGSVMGLYQYVKENYRTIEVDAYLEEIPAPFLQIQRTGELKHEIPEGKVYDLFICLDCGDLDRLGFAAPLFRSAKHTFCIDHHVSNQAFADDNLIVPDASSTSELVYRQIDKSRLTKGIAEALYMGIVHDTGVFRYSCTSPDTMRAAADLLEFGIDAPALIDSTFDEKTYAQNQILGKALLESMVFMDGKCIVSSVRMQELEFYGVAPKELDGIVSQLRLTKGVEVAVFLYELEKNVFKVSLRSKKSVDVSRVAKYFGGGGHILAAGCTLQGTVHDVINNLARQLELQLKPLENEA